MLKPSFSALVFVKGIEIAALRSLHEFDALHHGPNGLNDNRLVQSEVMGHDLVIFLGLEDKRFTLPRHVIDPQAA